MDTTETEPLSGADIAKNIMAESDGAELLEQAGDEALNAADADKNLDLMRNILFGEQVRATEKKHAALERHIRDSVAALNQETQQQIKSLRDELQELSTRLEQTRQQLQHDKADRQSIASLLQGMARQLSDDEQVGNTADNRQPVA